MVNLTLNVRLGFKDNKSKLMVEELQVKMIAEMYLTKKSLISSESHDLGITRRR